MDMDTVAMVTCVPLSGKPNPANLVCSVVLFVEASIEIKLQNFDTTIQTTNVYYQLPLK